MPDSFSVRSALSRELVSIVVVMTGPSLSSDGQPGGGLSW
jgi:hypothetical protein